MLTPVEFQPLPMTARIPWRYVVNYRVAPERARHLVPVPLELDLHEGDALISVCALAIERLGVAFTPRFLRFSTLEMLYRLAVRHGGIRSFVTLKSDVSSRAMAALGSHFSHFRPRLAAMAAAETATSRRLTCRDRDGRTSVFAAARATLAGRPETSRFPSLDEAVEFILGVPGAMSVDARGRVRFQKIDHPPWQAAFAAPEEHSFAFDGADALGLVYDSTLLITEQTQTWRAMKHHH